MSFSPLNRLSHFLSPPKKSDSQKYVTNIFEIAAMLEKELPFEEKTKGSDVYEKCFMGSTLVGFLLTKGLSKDKDEALAIFDMLLRIKKVVPLAGKYRLTGSPDLHNYYRLKEEATVDEDAALYIAEEVKLQKLLVDAQAMGDLKSDEEWFKHPVGWMYKRGEGNTAYKKRYFQLEGTKLQYYKSEDVKQPPKGTLPLDEVQTVSLPDAKTQGDRKHALQVRTHHREYVFAFDTYGDLLRWSLLLIDIVQSLRVSRRSSSVAVTPPFRSIASTATKEYSSYGVSPSSGGAGAGGSGIMGSGGGSSRGFTKASSFEEGGDKGVSPWESGVITREYTTYEKYSGNVPSYQVSYFQKAGLANFPLFGMISCAIDAEYDIRAFGAMSSASGGGSGGGSGVALIGHSISRSTTDSTLLATNPHLATSATKLGSGTASAGASTSATSIGGSTHGTAFTKHGSAGGLGEESAAARAEFTVLRRKDRMFKEVLNYFEWVFTPVDSILFKEGDKDDFMFLLIKGQVVVSKQSGSMKRSGHNVALTTVRVGGWFGELALMGTTYRTATAKVTEDALFLTLSSSSYGRLRERFPAVGKVFESIIQDRVASTLKNVPVFAFVHENKPWSKLDMLASLFKLRQFAPGDIIFKEGDPGATLCLVLDGSVEIQSRNPDGEVTAVNRISEGEVLGELSLIKQVPRTATAVAGTWTTLYELDKESFEKFLQIAPELKVPFAQVVLARTAATLRTLPLFATVNENKPFSKLDKLGELANYTKINSNDVIMERGTVSDAFHIILSGTAIITRPTETPSEEFVLRELKSSDSFGEQSILDTLATMKTTSSVVATSNCLLLTFKRDDFNKIRELVPEILPEFKKRADEMLKDEASTDAPRRRVMPSSTAAAIASLKAAKAAPSSGIKATGVAAGSTSAAVKLKPLPIHLPAPIVTSPVILEAVDEPVRVSVKAPVKVGKPSEAPPPVPPLPPGGGGAAAGTGVKAGHSEVSAAPAVVKAPVKVKPPFKFAG